jgi:hypothetical protein
MFLRASSRTHFLGGKAVLRTATPTGALEPQKTDSSHPKILNLGFAHDRKSIPEDVLLQRQDKRPVNDLAIDRQHVGHPTK